jgi:putative tricarboxylic transport membrane protein
MARIDRYIAVALLAFSIGYGYLAWTHPLLPFEARMPFKPNTMPLGLAGLGIVLSSLLLLLPGNDTIEKDAEGWRSFAWKNTALLIGLAIGYALLLRPIGFIASTTLFIVLSSRVLGETNFIRSISTGLISSGIIWYLVDDVLGIYLVALPAMIGGMP